MEKIDEFLIDGPIVDDQLDDDAGCDDDLEIEEERDESYYRSIEDY